MAETANQHETWLVAAWPGMGNVGVGAAAYLVHKLGATTVHEIPPAPLFDLQHVEVNRGLAKPGRLPRSLFFEWTNPSTASGARDLLIFLGEAQPQAHGFAFCKQVMDFAMTRGVKHVFTFAAMATQLHPSDAPRVFGVGTNGEALRQLQSMEVLMLNEGQISGLNGVLLAAAIEREIPGTCLLGELPYFAAGVVNPRASQAVLESFCSMAGVELDFAEIRQHADVVQKGLLELLEKMQRAAQRQAGEESFAAEESETEPELPVSESGPSPPDAATAQRIEALFAAAHQDRSRAVALKQELDRLGVFKQYEDRFLDLFKKAE
jgi:proteasome assembly chaperone (PAC2) family protein